MTDAKPLELAEWRAAAAAISALLFLQITVLSLEIGRDNRQLVAIRTAYILLCAGALLLLVVRRGRLRPWLVIATFLATFLPLFSVIWMAQTLRAREGTNHLFLGLHLMALVLAATAPGPIWLSVALIAGLAIEGVAQHLWLGPAAPLSEPWATLAICVIAIGLCVSRARRMAAAREVERRRAEVDALARLTETMLAIEDLANTPLQTIALSAVLVRARCSELGPVVDRMDRAIARLSDLRELVNRTRASAQGSNGERGAPPQS